MFVCNVELEALSWVIVENDPVWEFTTNDAVSEFCNKLDATIVPLELMLPEAVILPINWDFPPIVKSPLALTNPTV